MKNWKRHLAIWLVLALAFSVAACGFSSKMARAAVEMDAIESFHMDMTLELSVALSLVGQQSEIEMLIEEKMDVQREPLKVASEIHTMADEEIDTALGYLLPAEDGSGYVLYVSRDGGESWDRAELDGAELSEHTGYSGTLDQLSLLAKVANSFREVGKDTINGASATRYEGVIKGEYVTQALENSGVLGSLGEEFGVELDMSELQIDGSIPASVWVDDDSGRIVRYDMDMAEAISSVWDVIMANLAQDEAFAALSRLGLELTIAKAKVSATLSQFDEVGEIVLPEGVE